MKRNQLLQLYLTQSLRLFGSSLLALFSSVYIYQSLGSLSFVFLFFLFYYFFKLLANFLAEDLALRLGLKRVMLWGECFLIFALGLLFFSGQYRFLFFPAAVFWGTSAGFYWFGRHGLMAKTAPHNGFGQAVGRQQIFDIAPVLASPILGGILINYFGYRALFFTSLFCVFLSLFSLRPLLEKKTHIDTSPAEIFRLFKTHKRTFLAYLGDSTSMAIYSMAFPLYLFLILGKELAMGEFFSLVMILVAIINFLIGKLVDIKGKREFIIFGSVFSSLVWLGRLIAMKINILFVLDILDRITAGMTSIPLSVLTYEKALDGGATGRAVLFREMAMGIGAIFACLLLLVVNSLRFSFILAAVLTLFPLLLLKKGGIYGDGHQKA